MVSFGNHEFDFGLNPFPAGRGGDSGGEAGIASARRFGAHGGRAVVSVRCVCRFSMPEPVNDTAAQIITRASLGKATHNVVVAIYVYIVYRYVICVDISV
jgi:hypothetical protein